VTVELWPDGDATEASQLGQMAIANVTPDDDPASYVAAVVDASGELVCPQVVRGHRRKDGWAAFVSRALSLATIDNSDEVEKLTSQIVALLAGSEQARRPTSSRRESALGREETLKLRR
jgi:hypothetical protein